MLRLRRLAAIAVPALAATMTHAPAQAPPGKLVVAQIAEPKSLDPHAVTAVNDFSILMNVYDGLVRTNRARWRSSRRWPRAGMLTRTERSTPSTCATA